MKFITTISIYFLLISDSYAYLDPGTFSIIAQFFIGIFVFILSFFQTIKIKVISFLKMVKLKITKNK